ncbi:MAG: hypothetical protein OMM_06743 [Candidatus Magnetoglobus multicellularis str. Araruama]|uniref:Uncharacterized protein n=1 Tax=Candidatus Magnetoglobus multicellularis str. Araruama TaxID=890399 RepID=A0A1V1PG66_9BACT|nr:MAG: hypothetical protein OMM_06743 [Candidatus Magnetoglobus multicellularis str. Araruama]
MKTLIGGAIAALLGLIGLAIWWKPFLQLLAGTIPVGLLLGGCLALYLGLDELKDTWRQEGFDAGEGDDSESLKQKLEELEKENEALKANK